jgi:hypothetical protein
MLDGGLGEIAGAAGSEVGAGWFLGGGFQGISLVGLERWGEEEGAVSAGSADTTGGGGGGGG